MLASGTEDRALLSIRLVCVCIAVRHYAPSGFAFGNKTVNGMPGRLPNCKRNFFAGSLLMFAMSSSEGEPKISVIREI